MLTLDQAARQLGISEKTLRRWLALIDPPITPTTHRYDRRYRMLSEDDVARIRAERDTLPEKNASRTPISRPQAHQTGATPLDVSGQGPMPARLPVAAPTRTNLPTGMMGRQEAALTHGIPLTTLRRWCDEGRIETDSGAYGGERGRYAVKMPLTVRGLAQFYALASHRTDFTPCPDCPHSAPGESGS